MYGQGGVVASSDGQYLSTNEAAIAARAAGLGGLAGAAGAAGAGAASGAGAGRVAAGAAASGASGASGALTPPPSSTAIAAISGKPGPEILKMLTELHLSALSNENVTIEITNNNTLILTLKIPVMEGGGTIKKHRTLKSTKKSHRAALSNKKVHHKQHKNPTTDEEEDIRLALV